MDVFGANLAIFGSDRCRYHLGNLLSSSSSSKIPNLVLEFRRHLSDRCYRDVIISCLGGHIDIAGCRWLLYLLASTIFHLYMVLYPRFVVGIYLS